MNLSYISDIINEGQIVRECEFDSLGLATSHDNNKKVLSFLVDIKYLDSVINNKNIVGIICNKDIYQQMKQHTYLGILLTENPKQTFFEMHNYLTDNGFYWKKFDNNISPKAKISDKAIIGDNSIVIGENTIIEDGAVVHPGSIIGSNVIIRSGAQIGSNGFQFVNNGRSVISVKTAGRVILKNNVEVQHNSCIDRGVLGGDTILEEDVKVDNLVYIAHDVHLGERTFVTAGVKIGGRVTTGKDCWLGLNSTISNGINIGDNCRISLGAVVTKNVLSDSVVSGNFAIDHQKFIDFIKSIR